MLEMWKNLFIFYRKVSLQISLGNVWLQFRGLKHTKSMSAKQLWPLTLTHGDLMHTGLSTA